VLFTVVFVLTRSVSVEKVACGSADMFRRSLGCEPESMTKEFGDLQVGEMTICPRVVFYYPSKSIVKDHPRPAKPGLSSSVCRTRS
jgi:hypothetical protein